MARVYGFRRVAGLVVLGSVGVGTAGCAPHAWVAGPNVSAADFIPTKARCSMMARHSGNSIAAAGSVRFVVAAQVANAIGNAFQADADFDDCMQASGFLIADGTMPPAASTASAHQDVPARQIEASSERSLAPQNAMSVVPVSATPLSTASPLVVSKPVQLDSSSPIVQPPSTPNGDVTYNWGAPSRN